MRRTESLHAPAFLVDENQHVLAFDRVLEGGDERAKLVWRLAIPRKDNKAARSLVGEEPPFGLVEGRARAPRDEGFKVNDAA